MGNTPCLRAILGRSVVQITMDPGAVHHIDGNMHGTYLSYDDLTPTSIHGSDVHSVYGDTHVGHNKHGTATGSIRRFFGRLSHRRNRKDEIHSKSNLLNTILHHDHTIPRQPPEIKIETFDNNKNLVPRDVQNARRASDHDSSSIEIGNYDVMHTPVVTLGNYLVGIFKEFHDTVALIENQADMTFNELVLMIDKLCRSLAKLHFSHGHVLCFISNNATYLIMFLCAVTLLGGIFIPLDPNCLLDLTPVVLNEHKVRLIVTDQWACKYVQKAAWRAKLYRAVYCIGHHHGARPISELISHDLKSHHHHVNLDQLIDPKFDTAIVFYTKIENGESCVSYRFTHYSVVVNILQVATLVTDDIGSISLVCNSQNTHWRRLIGSLLGSLVKGHSLIVTHGTSLVDICQTMKKAAPRLVHMDNVLLDELLQHNSMKQHDWSHVERIFCVADGSLQKSLHKTHLENKAFQLFGHPASLFTHFSTATWTNDHVIHCFPLPRTKSKIIDSATGHHLKAGNTGEMWVRGPQLCIHDSKTDRRGTTYDCYGWLDSEFQGHIDTDGHLYFHLQDGQYT